MTIPCLCPPPPPSPPIQDQRRRFIKFVWGQERLPSTDAEYVRRGVRLLIKPVVAASAGHADNLLPRSDTCFFNLELPAYSSEEVMFARLLTVANIDCGLDGDDVEGA
jgi:hypothetical protein